MIHLYRQGSDPSKPVLLLLHGTGGTEHSLLELAPMLDPDASVLSVRGNVSEHGMPRFFLRLAEGVFDEEDLIFRTKELHDFLHEAADRYAFDRKRIVAAGYSNGANIAGSLLLHYEQSLHAAILFHPMVPRRGIEIPDMTGLPIFIGAGRNDPICPPQETEELIGILEGAQANVRIHWESNGHQLTASEVKAAAEWLRTV